MCIITPNKAIIYLLIVKHDLLLNCSLLSNEDRPKVRFVRRRSQKGSFMLTNASTKVSVFDGAQIRKILVNNEWFFQLSIYVPFLLKVQTQEHIGESSNSD
jgi:hypothetical protein